ncbi:hypothetical protein SteCoe_15051 [Stentor coeruleus]|uniref:Ion transport domain-containing protein n=1 Tax=Stentor coeruleus TaxID=5963 RepID=A0A1R2C4K4_9CILI|nr:hypothetical protein SteCoe_15051 [Stentor coeruleus]
MLGKISSIFQGYSKVRATYNKEAKIDVSAFKSMGDEFTLATNFISDTLPLKIEHQFEGTCLRIQKDDRYYVFVSRQGILAVIDSREKIIIRDEVVTNDPIWALALSPDEKYIYCAGANPIIKKYTLDALQLENEYLGHTGDVNYIEISANNEWMVSCSDDCTVRLWGFDIEKIPNKTLFSHTGTVFCMDLSEDNIYIASGSQDYTANIYQLEWDHRKEVGHIIATLSCKSEIWAVKIASSNKFVVTGDALGNIEIWRFLTWEPVRQFKEDQRIRSIDISKDESLLVTAGAGQNVVIWHLNKDRKPLILEGHKDMIKSALLSNDQQFIVSLADDKSIIRWKIPYFGEKHVLNTESEIVELWGVGDYVCGLTKDMVITWDLQGVMINTNEIGDYSYYYATPDCTLFFLVVESEKNSKFTSKIKEYRLNPWELIREATIITGRVTSLVVSDSKSFLCVGELYKISTFMVQENMKLFNSQIYHDDSIIKMILTPNDCFLFSIGQNLSIKMIDTFKMNDAGQRNVLCEISDFIGKSEIVDIFCCKDSTKLLVLASDELMIWSINSKAPTKKVALEKPVSRLLSSRITEYFFLQNSDGIEFWCYKDFNFITRLGIPNLETFTFANNEQSIIIKTEAKIEISESPLLCKNLNIIGEDVQSKMKKFCSYVKKIIANKSDKYIDDYKNWLVMPFMFNIQHIYAYYNYDNYLKEAYIPKYSIEDPTVKISKGNAPYVSSANKITPLSVSVNQEFPECAKVVLKALRKRWTHDPYSLVYVSDDLTALNNFGLDGLQKLYDFALRKSFLTNMPTFCKNVSLPIVYNSSSIETDPTTMLGPTADTSDGTAISFEHTCFKLNMNLGSSEGIDFMESLANCKNDKIFETPLVRMILEEKWKKARFVMYGQAMLYMFFIITLSYYSTLELNSGSFLIIPASINGALLIYEIYQMFAGGLDYFKDAWNYIDLIRSSLFFIFAIFVWVELFDNNTNFLALIILITWIRGITYFRIFGPTRYLINLLFEVFTDIPAFLVIFFYTILAFSFIFYSLLGINPDQKYYETFVETYSTTLGNSNTQGYSKTQWFFYLLITLFNFIIMLNLLISILSDTYIRVKDMQIIADGQELASMVVEVEMMLFWRSELNDKQYVHLCRDQSVEEASEHKMAMTKFKAMNMKCNEYERVVSDNLDAVTAMRDNIKSQNDGFLAIINQIKDNYGIK